jgi:hypothetical protein
VDAPTLAPVGAIGVDAGSQELLVAVAARIGGTRLIDNALVRVRPDGGVETLESFNGQVNATGRK